MEQVRDELSRLIRQEAALKVVLDNGSQTDLADQVRVVLLAVQARIVYLKNTLLFDTRALV
jgi:hypothetical protein